MENKKIYWHTLTNSYALVRKPDTSVIFLPVDDGHITAIVDTSTFERHPRFNRYAEHTRYMYYEDIDVYGEIIDFKEGTAEHFVNQAQDLY